MPDGSADCIVTSPPYWAKRDYGVAGQYGCEPDPDGYVATLRAVFREARRVLADDGTCWLNLGDSYSVGSATPSGLHAYLGPGLAGPARARHGGQEPARPALAGRPRPPGRRLDPPQRHRLAQAQRHARVGPRPAQLPVRTRSSCSSNPATTGSTSTPSACRTPPPGRAARLPPGRAAGGSGAPSGRTGAPAGRQPPGRHAAARSTGPHREVVAARRYGTGGAARRAPATAATPATSGRSPPAPTGARTSPPSRSSSRLAASRRAASQAAWCSTRSAAPAPPALPPSPSDGASPASNSTQRSPPWPPNGCGMLPSPSQTATEGGRP